MGVDEDPSLQMLEGKLQIVFFLFFRGLKGETAFRNWFCWGSTNHQGCEDKENAEDAEEEEMVSVRF
jgi:hypothetical protein